MKLLGRKLVSRWQWWRVSTASMQTKTMMVSVVEVNSMNVLEMFGTVPTSGENRTT